MLAHTFPTGPTPVRAVRRLRAAMTRACGAAVAALELGCASPVEVEYDPDRDFARYRTWDWVAGEAIVVKAPFEDEATVAALLARSVEQQLEPRGLVRSPGGGDVRVGAVFAAVRDHQYIERAGALETLSTHHETPSYETQSVRSEVRVVDRCRVSLYVSDRASGDLVWQASVVEHRAGGCRARIGDAVARLVERFPR